MYIHREENAPVYQKNSDGDIAYDNKNKPIVESYLTNQAIQHEDNDYIEEENIESLGYADTLYMNLDTSKLKELGWSAKTDLIDMYKNMSIVMSKNS